MNNQLKIKDHSISNQVFELNYDDEFAMYKTKIDLNQDFSQFYKSDEYISHTDSKRNLFEKVYHLVRQFSLKSKLRLINKYSSKGKLLDFGSGTGDFLLKAQQNNWSVTGIEPNPHARDIANFKTNDSVYDIPHVVKMIDEQKESYNCITLWHVLEHIPNLEEQMNVMHHLLTKNGTLIIAVPNFKSFDAEYYKEFWAAFDVPRHLWHFSQTSILKFAEKHQFKLIDTLPMKLDSYYVSLLSEKYKTGKMNFINAFRIGLKSNLKAKKTSEYSSLIYILKKN